jgi:hypothetical protein
MRSRFEERIAEQLEEAGMDYEYEAYEYDYYERLGVYRASCEDCGSRQLVRMGTYTPDFFLSNGIIVETKGKFTAKDRRKMLAVIEQYPDEDIRMCFMTNNKLTRRSTKRYSDWCEDNNVKYCIGEIDETWLRNTTSKDERS